MDINGIGIFANHILRNLHKTWDVCPMIEQKPPSIFRKTRRKADELLYQFRRFADSYKHANAIGIILDMYSFTVLLCAFIVEDLVQKARADVDIFNGYFLLCLSAIGIALVRHVWLDVLSSPTISLKEMGTIMTRATYAIQESNIDDRPSFDIGKWRNEYRRFESNLIRGLQETCDDDIVFSTNVMLYLERQQKETYSNYSKILESLSYTVLGQQSTFVQPYPNKSIGINDPENELRGEVVTIISSIGSNEEHIRIPVHRYSSGVLMGAPLVVDKLIAKAGKTLNSIRLVENKPTVERYLRIDNGLNDKNHIDCHPAFAFAYYENTHNLKDSDFRPAVDDRAKRRIRTYFQETPTKSLISVAFTPKQIELAQSLDPDNDMLPPVIGVLNINASEPNCLRNKKVQVLVLQALQVYALSLGAWLSRLENAWDDQVLDHSGD